ncbi:MAG: flagellar basal body-associated FliL family protein [Candidatus Aureabacteria bacterium]|nr:flagellar basal body-associated FliL family protein [Candidatus Auribacterota bacterium]
MAEEKKGAAPQQGQEKKEQPTAPAEKKLLSGKNMLIGGLLIIFLGTGTFFGMKSFLKVETEKPGIEKEILEDKKMPDLIESFDTLIVNIMGTQGTRYLKVSVSLELEAKNEDQMKKEFETRKYQMTDILNSIFSSKPMEQIDNPASRNNIKREIRDKLNELLINGQVKDVFFRDFVIQ